MKKSEMISLMAKVMEENFDGDNGSWEQDVAKVLAAMEKAGMLPPSCATMICDHDKFQIDFTPGWDEE